MCEKHCNCNKTTESIKLDFHDLRVKPKDISNIESRSEINPFYEVLGKHQFLPIITAPMDTVINTKNSSLFQDCKIHTIIRSGETLMRWGSESYFISKSLTEFIGQYIKIDYMEQHFQSQNTIYVLIDMANGHMEKLLDTVKQAKKMYADKMVLMVGNVANPETYRMLSEAGADMIRIGIGNGNACLTTKQTTVGYPMASLIRECYELKNSLSLKAKIIADGGMKDFSDIILALALGADYVMVGSLLNQSLESCGDTYLWNKIKINQYSKFAKWLFKNKFKLTKKFRGMSTKEVQRKWNKDVIKTSEGIVKKQSVNYTIEQWVENFEDYLRSTMSYSNAKNLEEFIGKAEFIQISDKAYQRFNK